MSILTEMVRNTERRLSRLITAESAARVRAAAEDAAPPRDFLNAIHSDTVQVIAEIKKASPSRGSIKADLDVAALSAEYQNSGAAAVSVLTDEDYFAGSLEDLRQVRAAVSLPVLRKDFIISPYQIYEARAAGADAILLIVGALYPSTLATMLKLTQDLGMAALVEVHTHQELDFALNSGAGIIGINNRDLNTLEVCLDIFMDLAYRVPPTCTLVSESGIHTRSDVEYVSAGGADAVLVGTSLVADASPGRALAGLLGVPAHPRQGHFSAGAGQRLDTTAGGWSLP